MPLYLPPLEYRAGLTNHVCPNCGQALHEDDAIQVTPATVIDVVEVWLERPVGRWPEPMTEKIPVVYVARQE